MAVVVGSGENVGGMDEGVNAGGTGVEAGAHPLNKTASTTNVRNMERIDFFMKLPRLILLRKNIPTDICQPTDPLIGLSIDYMI